MNWYRNPVTGVSEPVPCHREVKKPVARRTFRTLTEESIERRSDEDGLGDAEQDAAADSRYRRAAQALDREPLISLSTCGTFLWIFVSVNPTLQSSW